MTQFLKEVKILANALVVIVKPMDPNEVNANIFHLHGGHYHPVVAFPNSRGEPLFFHELSCHLLFYKTLIQSTTPMVQPLANITDKVSTVGSNQHRQYQNQNNGNRNDGYNKSYNNNQKRKGKFKPKCQISGYNNHFAINYRKCFDHNNEGPRANNSQVNTAASTSDWFLNSAATHYMTFEIGSLCISEDYSSKDQVLVGNAQGIEISRIEKSTLSFGDKMFVLSDMLFVP